MGGINELNTNADVAMEIITRLYFKPYRSSHLVREVQSTMDTSEPTIYAVLKELIGKNIVRKDAKSKRKVVYYLTDGGKKILEKEHFSIIHALIQRVKDDERRREILVELLLEDVLRDLPHEIKDKIKYDALRKSMRDEVQTLKKRLINIASALFL